MACGVKLIIFFVGRKLLSERDESFGSFVYQSIDFSSKLKDF